MWGIRSRDGVTGRDDRVDKPCLEQMKFEVLAGPLSGQKKEAPLVIIIASTKISR